MVADKSKRSKCYESIEAELVKSGFAYKTQKSAGDGVLDADDVLVYKLSNQGGLSEIRVMPTSWGSSPEEIKTLTDNIVKVIQTYSPETYDLHFVLCGAGWTDSLIDDVKSSVSASFYVGKLVRIYTVDQMLQRGFQSVFNDVPQQQ